MADFILSSPSLLLLSSSSLSFSQNNIIKFSPFSPHITPISPPSLPPSLLSFSLSKNRINPQNPSLSNRMEERKKEKEEYLPCLEHEIFKTGLGEWKERKKEERKEEKNPLFHPQNGVLPLSWEKKEIPQNPSVSKGLGGRKKGKRKKKGMALG